MNCLICESDKVKKIADKYPSYIKGQSYEIFYCSNCDTQFVQTDKIDSKVYNIIYSNKNTPGYSRYFDYARKVKQLKNPLKFLAKEEAPYFPIYDFFKNRKEKLKILEVGCSYGYLTYSLKRLGHDITGIDLSSEAISYAKSNFGNFFESTPVEKFKTNEKFDVIIATELIEHLKDPKSFLSDCLKLLKNNGKIILSTPNKDYHPRNFVWCTDSPPIHTFWFGKKSFESIAKSLKLGLRFTNFSSHVSKRESKILSYIISRRKITPLAVINLDGTLVNNSIEKKSFAKKIASKITYSAIVRYVSHFISKLFIRESGVLGVILTKN